ncbi:molybdopterin molybdotransferase MoeA [Fibrella forsythiae]|uniref:Molybdopterin molybdenumtransferase n=1 Tax=Fibrella forsythiae TaxID=2817061 RepID=A0ABS3JQP7_9BACT|nr:molybdopterin molybdotransferase MoeA [Fibrella forsythiae]MBO0951257.1 molybdopterin molybdotransferase MoeA [Fibrella forsythiae]
MLTVADADQLLADHGMTLTTETVPFSKARGRVLAETILADRDFPPFDRVAMDGIAIHYDSLANGQVTYPILAIQRAGEPLQPLPDPTGCLEVMTGAMLPTGADTVIRYEDLSITDGVATLTIPTEMERGQNVHKQGTDRRTFDVLLPAGTMLRPVELAVVASVGQTSVSVLKRPRVAVIATGDELVDTHQTPLPHQIRQSNVYMLQAALYDMGLDASVHTFPDDVATITAGLSTLLTNHDVLIMTGGVSAGKADFVPEVLGGLGIRCHFHKVEQRPGRPLWFGSSPDQQRVVFALPGNPVSTTMCFYRYARPYLQTAMGLTPDPPLYVELAKQVTFKPAFTYFMPVRLEAMPDGRLLANPLPGSGSGDFTNLTAADAFLELPAASTVFPAGTLAPAWSIG